MEEPYNHTISSFIITCLLAPETLANSNKMIPVERDICPNITMINYIKIAKKVVCPHAGRYGKKARHKNSHEINGHTTTPGGLCPQARKRERNK